MGELMQPVCPRQIYLEGYQADGGELTLYLSSDAGAEWQPAQEDFNVSLGRETLPVTGSSTVEEAKTPVAAVFLVDVSGSLDSRRMEDMKTVISGIAGKLREQDRICIVAMGDELRASGFMTDKEEIQAQIDALSVRREDTNLYQGIEASLALLQSEETAGARKCLVVLSDGAEDNSYGITREEVNDAIQGSRIPVYTVGVPKSVKNREQLDNVKVLGSFARASAGGIHYVPSLDGTDYVQTAESIWGNVMAGRVVTADVSGLRPAGQEVYLQVSVGTEESGVEYAGVTVVDSRILTETAEIEESSAEEEGETETETETMESIQPEGESAPKKSSAPLLAGLAVLVAIFVGILLLVAGKKKKAGKMMAPPEGTASEGDGHTESPAADMDSVEAVGITAGIAETVGADNGGSGEIEPERMAAAGAGLRIQLIRMGIGETLTYSLVVEGSLSMGRDPQAADFAVPEDRGLSARHCIFYYEEGALLLEDADSTNGTYVNGIPIKTPIRLNRDDVLLAGSYEYRIYW